jgi:hypothetical protein
MFWMLRRRSRFGAVRSRAEDEPAVPAAIGGA